MTKRLMRPLRFLLIALLFALALALHAYAREQPFALRAEIPVSGAECEEVQLQKVNAAYWLFLPSQADVEALTLRFEGEAAELIGALGAVTVADGDTVSLPALCGDGAVDWTLTLRRGDEELSFTVARGEGLRALFLHSEDAAKKGRSYVDAEKDRKVKGGSFTLLRPDGSAVWSGKMKNIKSRGNSTWKYPKKPYQVKLAEDVDLLDTGLEAERESTWILLADYIDESRLHNRLSFDIAAEMGLPYTPHSASVDLYYDGEYRGVYLLCEKTEVSSGRVDVHDLEADIEALNPEVEDFDALPTARGKTETGIAYQYVAGLNTPEDYSGGYLLEMDYSDRATAEKSWFQTGQGKFIVCKSPEYLPEDAMRYIAELYGSFERAVAAGGTDPVTGADYRDLADLDSLARCFLLMELAEDNDAFTSSSFFYKPSDEERLYAGPVWDFDSGYGSANLPADSGTSSDSVLGWQLLQIPSFREALQRVWEELEPTLRGVVLSGDPAAAGRAVRSIAGYGAELAASMRMDAVLWPGAIADSEAAAAEALAYHLAHRLDWFAESLADWCDGRLPDRQFLDVAVKNWYYDAVKYVVDKGLLIGYSEHVFAPGDSMTRAMAVVVLHRFAGLPAAEASAGYTDVRSGTWYADAVDWATERGIANGTGDGRFGHDEPATREQFVTMLWRYATDAGLATASDAALDGFRDVSELSDWALEAVTWAVGNGLLNGSSGRLMPTALLTRAQASAILMRFHQLLAA